LKGGTGRKAWSETSEERPKNTVERGRQRKKKKRKKKKRKSFRNIPQGHPCMGGIGRECYGPTVLKKGLVKNIRKKCAFTYYRSSCYAIGFHARRNKERSAPEALNATCKEGNQPICNKWGGRGSRRAFSNGTSKTRAEGSLIGVGGGKKKNEGKERKYRGMWPSSQKLSGEVQTRDHPSEPDDDKGLRVK